MRVASRRRLDGLDERRFVLDQIPGILRTAPIGIAL